MIALLALYKWAIFAGSLSAPSLSLLGVHLATRDRAMQTLCIGQGAMVGVLLGIGFFHDMESSIWFSFAPFGTALIVSSLTFLITDKLVMNRVASKNTFFAFIFSMLMATSHLIGALFPGLETHMAQIYFGDLATLTVFDSQIMGMVGILSLGLLAYFAGPISNQSFELAVFGKLVASRNSRWQLGFKVLSLVVLCFSIQFLGFLFTIAMLFVPTAITTYFKHRGLRLHFIACALLSVLSTWAGFLLSLTYTRLPTVPAIVVMMLGFGIVFIGIDLSILGFKKFVGELSLKKALEKTMVQVP